jgi:2-polyprenyl-3-methyl-5-hydroxy-6-metoxy-1,4-benzoquinol methylase
MVPCPCVGYVVPSKKNKMENLNSKLHACDFFRYGEMKKLIDTDETKTILGIGGGLFSIAKGLKGKEIITLDVVASFKPTIKSDLNDPLPLKASSVDIIIAGEVIEHLINPFRFLLEVKRVLREGGQFILSTPNEVDLKSRLKVLVGKLPTNCARPFATEEDQIFNHKADYNWEILKEMLEKAGFKILKKKNTGIFLGNKLIIHPRFCPFTLGEKFIIKVEK